MLKLTIDHTKVTGTLTNFPVLFSENVTGIPSTFWSSVTDSDGLDIRFYDTDNATELKREIFSFNKIAKTIEAWIQIPSLTNSIDKVIWCRYGGSTVSNSTEVWTDIGASLIVHMGKTQGSYDENNSAGSTGLTVTGPSVVPGIVGKAYQFVNDSDIITWPDTGHSGTFTVCAWAYATFAPSTYGLLVTTPNRSPLFLGITPADDYGIYGAIGWGNSRNFDGWSGIGSGNSFVSQQNFWKRVVVTYGSSMMRLYVDGSQVVFNAISNMLYEPGIHIGSNGGAYSFKGMIDEVNCYTDVKTAQWISTEFNNQNDPISFMTASEATVKFNCMPMFLAMR